MNLEHKCSTAILLVKRLGSLLLISEVLTTTATSLLNKLVLSEAGVLRAPAIFVPSGSLCFRESAMPEAQFPRITLLGSWVNRGNTLFYWA